MGKGAKGSGAGSASAAAAQSLSRAARLERQGAPMRREVFRQAEEALRTGGVGARIPQTQRAIEATKQATSQALAAQEKGLAGTGLAGTPWGQQALAVTRQMGAQQQALIPTQMAEAAIARAMGLQGPTLGALSQAGATAGQTGMGLAQAQLAAGGQQAGALGGAAGSAAGMIGMIALAL